MRAKGAGGAERGGGASPGPGSRPAPGSGPRANRPESKPDIEPGLEPEFASRSESRSQLRISPAFESWLGELACPACHHILAAQAAQEGGGQSPDEAPIGVLVCPGCRRRYPVVDGIPVLIVERAS